MIVMSTDYSSAYKSHTVMTVVQGIPSVLSGGTTQLSPVPFPELASHNAVHSSGRTAGAIPLKVWASQNFIL